MTNANYRMINAHSAYMKWQDLTFWISQIKSSPNYWRFLPTDFVSSMLNGGSDTGINSDNAGNPGWGADECGSAVFLSLHRPLRPSFDIILHYWSVTPTKCGHSETLNS